MSTDSQDGFPRWRILRGAFQQARNDLVSFGGAFATAIALGLASESFPDQAGADLGHRILHGLVVVVGTLAVLSLADGIQRVALYRRRSRRRWTVSLADHAGLLGFGLDSLNPAIPVPHSLLFVLCKPSGEFVTLWPDPRLITAFSSPTHSGGGSILSSSHTRLAGTRFEPTRCPSVRIDAGRVRHSNALTSPTAPPDSLPVRFAG